MERVSPRALELAAKPLTKVVVAFVAGFATPLAAISFEHHRHRPRAADLVPVDPNTDVEGLVTLTDPPSVIRRREALAEFVWGEGGFPQRRLPEIDREIADARFGGLRNVQRIDRLTLRMDSGLTSVAYYFRAANPNGEAVIYHQGHDGHFARGTHVIDRLTGVGYGVMALSMPLLGPNAQPVVHLERLGPVRIKTHGLLPLIPLETGSPLKFFLDPVAVSVNHLEGAGYSSVSMVGLSGGGWTTTVYAALDTRIRRSYPVAGSLPFFARRRWDLGDYEQRIPGMLQVANYLELYVMGSAGPGRGQVQILNLRDPCCFAGRRHEYYEAAVRERVLSISPGSFSVWLDETHRGHRISKAALDFIVADLAHARVLPPGPDV